MIITNNKGLPQAFVEMARRDSEPVPGEYRVTSLLKGIRESILERRHHSEIESDVSDMIWLLFGTAVHGILESQEEGADEIKETRLKMDMAERVLSGQFDLYNATTRTITDYKTASVWKIIFGNFGDWRKQLLVYAYMLRNIGFEVEHGEIVALLKDHSKRDAKFKPDYPRLPVEKVTFDFSAGDFHEIEDWLTERLEAIKAAEALPDDELPVCTLEERFNSGDRYAVMAKGKKRALRVLDTLEEAEAWKTGNGGDTIETRPGEDKKCAEYCDACEFCNYYHENVKEA